MHDVLDAIARVPGWSPDDVRIDPLPGGLTNANYLLTRGSERFVLRVSGPNAGPLGIDRAQECRTAATAAAAGIGPEVIHFSADDGLLVTRFIEGSAPERDAMRTPAMMARVVDALRRVHAFPPSDRDPTYCPFDKAEQWRRAAEERSAMLPDDFPILAQRLSAVRHDHPANRRARFCHNDPVRGNILVDGGGEIRLIDWEYAGSGDPVFDLAVLSMNNGYDDAVDARLLDAYFRGDVGEEHRRRLGALKLAFDYHMGIWHVLQTVVSTRDAPFAQGVRWHFDRLRRHLGVPVPAEA